MGRKRRSIRLRRPRGPPRPRASHGELSLRSSQNLASPPAPLRATQKSFPSLHAPRGLVPAPVSREPIAVRSAAFHSASLWSLPEETRTLRPSNAACWTLVSPLSVNVARTAPVEARTTHTEPPPGAQMFVPSKAGQARPLPRVTVCRMAPLPSSLKSLCAPKSVTQTLAPSKSVPLGWEKPAVTVVTVQGGGPPGVMMETDPPELADQMFEPS